MPVAGPPDQTHRPPWRLAFTITNNRLIHRFCSISRHQRPSAVIEACGESVVATACQGDGRSMNSARDLAVSRRLRASLGRKHSPGLIVLR